MRTTMAYMRMWRGGVRGGVIGAVALAALVAPMVGCGGGGDGEDGERVGGQDEAAPEVVVEATPDFVASAAARSGAEAYRMTTTYSRDERQPFEVLTGATDGRSTRMTLVLEPFEDDPSQAVEMEIVGDDDVQYFRTGAFTVDEYGEMPEAARPLQELGAEWGRIDMRRFEDGIEGIAAAPYRPSALGPPLPGPLFEALSDTEDVGELGREDVGGEELTGLSVEVSARDVPPVRGLRPLVPDDEFGQAAEVMVPVEIWVDDDGFIRRFEYEVSGAEVSAAIGGAPSDVVHRYEIEMDDYGADDISIELPRGSDVPDMTDAYAALLDAIA
jgi:hypothetical protein